MKSKAIQSANIHAHLTHAQAKADAVEGKAGHTPGPWSPCPGLAGYRFRIETMRSNNDCEPIAECKGPDREANARLIAAAPELLAALEEARDALRELSRHDSGVFGGDAPEFNEDGYGYLACRAIDRAIAKAKGSL